MYQALVPLKDLVQAKTRLAGLLRPSERRALAQSMVEDVLQVLSRHPGISRVILLSDDPGGHLLASRYGVDYWDEAEFQCRGLNPLIEAAAGRLMEENKQPILVLHGDIPLLQASELSAVIAAQGDLEGLIIGCDLAGSGTNLLAFDGGSIPDFHFGEDSCPRHQAAASNKAIPVQVMRLEGVGLDVDEPADLELLLPLLARYPERKTAKLLLHTALGERITMSLETLAGDEETAPEEGLRNKP